MARPGLTSHRKFRRLSRALGSPIVARGALELLWDSCYESGEEYVGTAEDIEAVIGWSGEPGLLARALVDAGAPEGYGFIEPVTAEAQDGPARFKVHDLWHHAPDYVAKRRQRELQRLEKTGPLPERRHAAPNGDGRVDILDWQSGLGRTPSPSPSPSPSPVEESLVPPVLVFPTTGPAGKEWLLSREQVTAWRSLFPTLDVLAEARKALAWVIANPGRRKTVKGMPKFLVNWLTRAVDRGGSNGQRPQPTAPQPAGSSDWWEECKSLHGGKCGKRYTHGERMKLERGEVA
jgi:hypothetical protein